MKIQNDTDYRSREIKSLLCATHDFLARSEGRLRQWRSVVFTVGYTRTRQTSGHATYHGTRSTLRFRPPNGRRFWRDWPGDRQPEDGHDCARAKDVVRLGYHEMLHLYGYRHDNMARYWPTADEVAEICEAAGFEPGDRLPLYASARDDDEDDEPTEAEKHEAELRHALRKRKEWTTKARRAKTGLEKWRSKEMYRRRKLEALGVDADAIIEDELGDYTPAMPGDLKV